MRIIVRGECLQHMGVIKYNLIRLIEIHICEMYGITAIMFRRTLSFHNASEERKTESRK